MPKEYVESFLFAPTLAEDGATSEPTPPFRVKVGWSRERGDVEIATVNPETEDRFDETAGYHVWLDRRGVNDLIRHLRRARDQAFGRDE